MNENLRKLNYEGFTIRSGDRYINATDLWRAAGSPKALRVSNWLGSAHAKGIIKELESRRKGQNLWPLVSVVRGRNGYTELHPQLALEYSRALSAALAIWCNEICMAYWAGDIIALDPEVAPEAPADDKVSDRFLKEFRGEVSEGHAAIRKDISDWGGNVIDFLSRKFEEQTGYSKEILKRQKDHIPRRPFAPAIHKLAAYTTLTRNRGRCWVCLDVVIVDENGNKTKQFELHHANGRNKNRRSDALACCCKCNEKLEDAEYAELKRPCYQFFQMNMNDVSFGHPQKPEEPPDQQEESLFGDL